MYYLNDLGVLCTLGDDKTAVGDNLLAPDAVPDPGRLFEPRGAYQFGSVKGSLPALPSPLACYDCRNNRLARAAVEQIRPAINAAIQNYGAQRVGIVVGTSTSGICESENAVRAVREQGAHPAAFHALQGMLGGLGQFLAEYLQVDGPSYTISTACSSSANAILGARRLLRLGLCDAVLVGGVDSYCELTLKGFGALEAQSVSYCKPFSRNRDGITIGEAAALFLMTREKSGCRLLGGAASSDAHHISAPHPEGRGAVQSMTGALADANLFPEDVDYLNLHGTATEQNDRMESRAVSSLFDEGLLCSSTKSMTGHTLGAAGALELGLCWLALTRTAADRLPPALYLDEVDTELPQLSFVGLDQENRAPLRICMSNSFAFGGGNVSLLIGNEDV